MNSKAIHLSPLSTPAFNADFDGDQMAVHVPLSRESIAEAYSLMLGSRNILGLKDGKPIAVPTQDMVLGNYYLTRENYVADQAIMVLNGAEEIQNYLDANLIQINDIILIPVSNFPLKPFTETQREGFLITTPGKVLLNDILPSTLHYINDGDANAIQYGIANDDVVIFGEKVHKDVLVVKTINELQKYIAKQRKRRPLNKKMLSNLVAIMYESCKKDTAKSLDAIKDLGFKYSTIAGFTISMFDLSLSDEQGIDIVRVEKNKLVADTHKKIKQLKELYERGLLTNEERRQSVISE